MPLKLGINPMTITAAISFAALLLFTAAGSGQQNQPCSAPEASQFDFWVGTWNLTWTDSGSGTNTITKELDGCVIEENFRSFDAQPFIGKSVSVFNVRTGKWHQTWVDNSGGYLDFSGGMEGDRMILSRTAHPAGKEPFLQRMVFYNIKKDSFDWNWEKSTDDGATWETQWEIHYARAK